MPITKRCLYCNEKFEAAIYAVKIGQGKFCSQVCGRRSRPKRSSKERFWEKVKKEENGCWVWIGAIRDGGYGQFNVKGKPRRAHRISWRLVHGKIPKGMCVLHNCPDGDNPACVNPEHLFLGTYLDNNLDCIEKGRYRHVVVRGTDHPLAKLNDELVRKLRRMYDKHGSSLSFYRLEKKYNISRVTLGLAAKRLSWKHVK